MTMHVTNFYIMLMYWHIPNPVMLQWYDLFAATVYYPTSSNYFCHLHLFMATVCLLRIGQAFFTTTFPSNNNHPNS